MVKRTGPTNPYLRSLVGELRKSESDFWRAVAEKLNKPTRQKVEVNLSDIERHAGKEGKEAVVVVPGTVLASGELTRPVTIAAWKFSGSAEGKIRKAKGKIMAINELMKERPKGEGVKIIV